MNVLNKSIVICDTPPRISQKKMLKVDSENKMPTVSKSLKAKTSPKKVQKKMHCKSTSRTCSRKVTQRGIRRKLNRDSPSDSNTVELIVLSDGETHDNEEKCIPLACRLLRRSLRLHKIKKRDEQKRKRELSDVSVAPAIDTAVTDATDVDSTCLIISDTDDANSQDTVAVSEIKDADTLCGTDPNQTSNDIMILWSSDDQSAANTKDTRFDEKANERLFMVDISPDAKNLNCLMPDGEPSAKRRKIECNAVIERLRLNGKSQTKRSSKRRRCVAPSLRQTNLASVSEADKKTTPNGLFSRNSSEIPVAAPGIETLSRINENFNVHYLRNNVAVVGTLREIIVDGSNIAMAYTNGKSFSEHGIKLVIEYFLHRGHSVKVFVPQHRRSVRHKYLEELYTKGIVVFTPSRNVAGKKITPYDDRFILQYATMREGVVVSLDQYRDLYKEKPEWRDTIEKRLLAPTFVDNYVMFPEDPLGRHGPKLDAFLRH